MPLPEKITDSIYFHPLKNDIHPKLLAAIDINMPNNTAYFRYTGTPTERDKSISLVLKKDKQAYPGKVHIDSKEVDGKIELEIHGGNGKHHKNLEDYVAYVKEKRKYNFLINCIPHDNPLPGIMAIPKEKIDEAAIKIITILQSNPQAQKAIFGFTIPNINTTASFAIQRVTNTVYLIAANNGVSTDSLLISKQQLEKIINYQPFSLHYSLSSDEAVSLQPLSQPPEETPQLRTQASSASSNTPRPS